MSSSSSRSPSGSSSRSPSGSRSRSPSGSRSRSPTIPIGHLEHLRDSIHSGDDEGEYVLDETYAENYIPKNLFDTLANNLTSLTIFKYNIRDDFPSLPLGLFDKLIHMESFLLEHVNFMHPEYALQNGLFRKNTKLETIRILDTNITTIPPKLFKGLALLKTIKLSNNKLTSIPTDLFKDNSKLRDVGFISNKLTSVPSVLFENNPMLSDAYFTENPNLREVRLKLPWYTPDHDVFIEVDTDTKLYVNEERWADEEEGDEEEGDEEEEEEEGDEEEGDEEEGDEEEGDEEEDPFAGGEQWMKEGENEEEPLEREEKLPFDVECINDSDYITMDYFTRGKDEYREKNKAIILSEGKGKDGNCFDRYSLIQFLLSARYGHFLNMYMMGPFPRKENRYFKLPYPSVWIDEKGLINLFKGWKILRLKKLRREKIGSELGISTTHGAEEDIYTLNKVNTKHQGKDEEIKYRINNTKDIQIRLSDEMVNVLKGEFIYL